ncbi:hypothetical protein [Piscirickettsia litoralis]|uniref:Type IV secretion system protein IcmG n=1 Tax=Piscirickettsia litoralis TaxID=1891921 RepID=A0ABX3A0T4_9GAMM|nr:hypothetical protein [Piscirickettsia litoralis]ODN42467.1 hypothetical protein BGC07_05400 [Piscirickettsia litoralis]
MSNKEECFDFESDEEIKDNGHLKIEEKESENDQLNFDENPDRGSSDNEGETVSVKEKPLSFMDKIKPRLRFYLLCLLVAVIVIFLVRYNYRLIFPEKKSPEPSQTQSFAFAGNNKKLEESQRKLNVVNQSSGSSTNLNENLKSNKIYSNSAENISSRNTDEAKLSVKLNLILNELNRIKENSKSLKNISLKLSQSDLDKITNSIKKELSTNQAKVNSYIQSNSETDSEIKVLTKKLDQALTSITKANENYTYLISKENNNFDKLTLRAIITGRAWLVNKEGKTLTVKQGDFLNGYGKVIKINDKNQEVVTSSGYIFK